MPMCPDAPPLGNLTTEILGLWSVWLKWDLESVACGLGNSIHTFKDLSGAKERVNGETEAMHTKVSIAYVSLH